MAKGNIVLVPFPFDALSGNKVRPAGCLTDSIGIHGHIVLAFITSNIPVNPRNTDYVIEASHLDFVSTGLRVASTITLHRLITVTSSIVIRQLGDLSPTMQNDVDARLRILFQL
ncbi:MAG: type II toxin-antitoxin system PemK/MazF family toxin [Chloroflexia bacterium]